MWRDTTEQAVLNHGCVVENLTLEDFDIILNAMGNVGA